MRHAVDAYTAALAKRGLRASSLDRAEYHLERILALNANGARPLSWVLRQAPALYEAAQIDAAVATHRNALAAAKSWAAWCVDRGWLPNNPFAAVKGVGRRRRGKPQLGVDDLRQLAVTCVAERSPAAIATLCAALLGMRATEITARRVRDLDDGGRLLRIGVAKTYAGVRCLEVPALLRPLLLELARGRAGDAPLFGAEAPSRYWLHYHVARLCRAARVPVVPPHGLRGSHATIATRAGQTGHAVAAALGHASPAITEAAYIAGGETAAARARAAFTVLAGGAGNETEIPRYQRGRKVG